MKKFYVAPKNHSGNTETIYDVLKREHKFQMLIRNTTPIVVKSKKEREAEEASEAEEV